MSSSGFEIGDRVRCVGLGNTMSSWSTTKLQENETYTVKNVASDAIQVEGYGGLWFSDYRFVKVEQEDNYKPNFVEVDFRIPQDLYELLEAIAYEHGLETETLIIYCLVDSFISQDQ